MTVAVGSSVPVGSFVGVKVGSGVSVTDNWVGVAVGASVAAGEHDPSRSGGIITSKSHKRFLTNRILMVTLPIQIIY